MLDLEVLDRLDDAGSDEQQLFVNARKLFERVHEARRGSAEQGARFAGDYRSVGQLNADGRSAGLLRAGICRRDDGAVGRGKADGVHDELYLADLFDRTETLAQRTRSGVVAADDLLLGGIPAGFVVYDAVAGHVDAHVRGALVRTLTVDASEDGVEYGEYFNVAVIVYRRLTVCLEMEGVYHVHIVEVGGGRLVGEVYRVLEGNVPDREGLELCIACVYSALVLMVKLAQTGRHFAAAGAGCGHDDEAALGFNVVVFAEAVLGNDKLNVRGVVGNYVVAVDLDAEALEPLLEQLRRRLAAVVSYDHAADEKAYAAERVNEPESVFIIGYAEVSAALVALDIICGDGDDDLRLVLHLQQHFHLAVRLKTRQNARGMVVVEQLAAEFKVQLASEFCYSLSYVARLLAHVFFVVEAYHIHNHQPIHSVFFTNKNYIPRGEALSNAFAQFFT